MKDTVKEILKKRQELRELELLKLLEEDCYKRSMQMQSALVRARFLLEHQRATKQQIVLESNDFKIIDKFMNESKLPEGRGLALYFELFLNYYKHLSKNQENITAFRFYINNHCKIDEELAKDILEEFEDCFEVTSE